MAPSNVKLLGRSMGKSPYTDRARIALNLKSIDYDFVEEDVFKKSQLLLESNHVYKKIPVLIHDNKTICESLVIVQYIDEYWVNGPSLLPSDPYDRAVARFWTTYIDGKWFPLLVELRMAKEEDARKAAIEKIKEGLVLLDEAFEKCSKGKAFFNGDSIGFLDIALGCFVVWLKAVEIIVNVKMLDENKIPGLVGWTQRFCSHEAVKGIVPNPQKLVKFHKEFQARARNAGYSFGGV